MAYLKMLLAYVNHDLWRIRLKDQSRHRSFVLRQTRILVLSVREFTQDKCMLRASALTYYTLLSIVPMLAVAFGVAKGFGMEEVLKEHLGKALEGQEDVVSYVITFSDNLLENVKGGYMAGLGIMVVLWATIKVLGYIESSFNDVWGIKRPRSLSRKFSDYLAFVLVSPVIFIAANSINIALTAEVKTSEIRAKKALSAREGRLTNDLGALTVGADTLTSGGETLVAESDALTTGGDLLTTGGDLLTSGGQTLMASADNLTTASSGALMNGVGAVFKKIQSWGWLGAMLLSLMLKIISLSMIWAVFTFAYLFMPNGKVRFSSGLIGGIVAGTLYIIVQRIYFHFQIGVSQYSTVYGSFAAFPFFLVWLQTSWLVVFYGAEVSFAHQNVDTYEFEPDCLKVSPAFKNLLTLGVAHRCVRAFDQGEPPPTADDIAHQLETPIRLVNQVLYELVEAKALSEVKGSAEWAVAYQPSRSIEDLTIADVLDLLAERGVDAVPLMFTDSFEQIAQSLREFRDLTAGSSANVKIKDIPDTTMI